MNKTILLGIAISGAFIVGILSANPVVEAVGGWQAAFDDLQEQINNIPEGPQGETGPQGEQGIQGETATSVMKKERILKSTSYPDWQTGETRHLTFTCPNNGVMEGFTFGVTSTSLNRDGWTKTTNFNIVEGTLNVFDDFTGLEYDAKKKTSDSFKASTTDHYTCLSIENTP